MSDVMLWHLDQSNVIKAVCLNMDNHDELYTSVTSGETGKISLVPNSDLFDGREKAVNEARRRLMQKIKWKTEELTFLHTELENFNQREIAYNEY